MLQVNFVNEKNIIEIAIGSTYNLEMELYENGKLIELNENDEVLFDVYDNDTKVIEKTAILDLFNQKCFVELESNDTDKTSIVKKKYYIIITATISSKVYILKEYFLKVV